MNDQSVNKNNSFKTIIAAKELFLQSPDVSLSLQNKNTGSKHFPTGEGGGLTSSTQSDSVSLWLNTKGPGDTLMQHTVSKIQQIALGPRLMLWPRHTVRISSPFQLLSANCMAGPFFFFFLNSQSSLFLCCHLFLQWMRTLQGICVKAFSLEADERCCKSMLFSIRTKRDPAFRRGVGGRGGYFSYTRIMQHS